MNEPKTLEEIIKMVDAETGITDLSWNYKKIVKIAEIYANQKASAFESVQSAWENFTPKNAVSKEDFCTAFELGFQSCQQVSVDLVGLMEWIQNNQFTMLENVWTSTKIHYSGCAYASEQLIDLYNEYLNKKILPA